MEEKNMDREAFLQESGKRLESLKAELAKLHGEPPCMYAVDIETVTGWSEEKRNEMRATLRGVVARAEGMTEAAEKERVALWEQSEATDADRAMPSMIPLKLLREDLKAYEDILNFVTSKTQAR